MNEIETLAAIFALATYQNEQGEAAAAEWLEQADQNPEWQGLATVVRAILAGEREREALLASATLDDVDQSIVEMTLHLIENPEELESLLAHDHTAADGLHPNNKRLALMFVHTVHGNESAQEATAQWFANSGQTEDWGTLAAVVKLFLNGERNEQVLLAAEHELDDVDQAIIELMLEVVDDPEAIEALSDEIFNQPDDQRTRDLKHFAVVFALTAHNNSKACESTEEWLKEFGETEEWKNLANVIRLFVAGERDRDVLLADQHNLDETDKFIMSMTLSMLENEEYLQAVYEQIFGPVE